MVHSHLEAVRASLPLGVETRQRLRVGDRVLLTGTLLAARDAAHRRMVEALRAGRPLPFALEGETIYYTGPTPAPPGRIVGAAGPTTSGRMDPFTPDLLAAGLVASIGKGPRSLETRKAMLPRGAVYLVATGGAGVLLAQHITALEIIAYEDLGPEAVRRLEVVDFPVIVANDVLGADIFEEARRGWACSAQ